MKKTVLISMICSFLGLGSALGQGFSSNPVGGAINHIGSTVGAGFYDATNERFRWDGLAILTGSTLTSYLLYEFADGEAASGEKGVWGQPGRVWTEVGGYLPYAFPVGFFLASRLYAEGSGERDHLGETAQKLAETLAFTFATTFTLKYSVDRERPDGTSLSFPSGHTSMAFATASVLGYQYGWAVGLPAFLGATSIAFTRHDLNKHYLSDLAFGAGIGLFFATAVHHFHRDRSLAKSSETSLPIMPLVMEETYGVAWAATF